MAGPFGAARLLGIVAALAAWTALALVSALSVPASSPVWTWKAWLGAAPLAIALMVAVGPRLKPGHRALGWISASAVAVGSASLLLWQTENDMPALVELTLTLLGFSVPAGAVGGAMAYGNAKQWETTAGLGLVAFGTVAYAVAIMVQSATYFNSGTGTDIVRPLIAVAGASATAGAAIAIWAIVKATRAAGPGPPTKP